MWGPVAGTCRSIIMMTLITGKSCSIMIYQAVMRYRPHRKISQRKRWERFITPNRIILFYQDAEVSAEYTPVGYFDPTEEFVDAVENNPVLEGWGNKIISISDGN